MLIPAELDFHNKSWIKVSFDPIPLFFWCSTEHSEATRKIWQLLPQNCHWISNSGRTRGMSAQTTCAICSLPRRRVKLVKNSHGYSSDAAVFFQPPGGMFPENHLIYFKYPFWAAVLLARWKHLLFCKHITCKMKILSIKFKTDQSAFTLLPAERGSNTSACGRSREKTFDASSLLFF